MNPSQLRYAAKRVRKGARYLDDKIPDWWRKVKVGRLDMHDQCRCVLGQIYGDYKPEEIGLAYSTDDIDRNRLSPDEAYGFDVPSGIADEEYTLYYERLTELWREEIKVRSSVSQETPR